MKLPSLIPGQKGDISHGDREDGSVRGASYSDMRTKDESNVDRRVMVRSRRDGRGRGGNKREKRVMVWSKRDRGS